MTHKSIITNNFARSCKPFSAPHVLPFCHPERR
jgi:hypothetical protein